MRRTGSITTIVTPQAPPSLLLHPIPSHHNLSVQRNLTRDADSNSILDLSSPRSHWPPRKAINYSKPSLIPQIEAQPPRYSPKDWKQPCAAMGFDMEPLREKMRLGDRGALKRFRKDFVDRIPRGGCRFLI